MPIYNENKGIFKTTGTSFDKGKNFEKKCWKCKIKYKNNSVSLGIYEDPFTAELVYNLVEKEIRSKEWVKKYYSKKVTNMKCEKCGKILKEDIKFCSECGTSTKKEAKTKEKHRLNISIDKNVWIEIKKEIPNVSEFVEEVFKNIINTKNSDEYQIKTKIQAEKERINIAEKQIELLEARLKIRREYKYSDKREKDHAWRGIWDTYRNNNTYEDIKMDEAVNILGWDKSKLDNLLQLVKSLRRQLNGVKAQEWEYVKELENKL